ncbi:MAG: putative molecular chaperone,hSP90 family [Rhodospirillales bacterium]|nr:putative molecular chaperone,hSP90 family [Rhodospirillales bacterium]
MTEEKLQFQAEVSRLLDIVAHSLYSEKEIFLRELISNASDACDRLRYAALTEPHLIADDPDLKVVVSIDRKAGTVTVADNGIGMNREDLVENLGTIARSGTARFLSEMPAEKSKQVSLIGQFGVGFYSAFMVAERVEVFSRKAGDERGWHWESEGQGSFTVGEAEVAARGTRVVLHLRKGDKEFLEPDRLRRIIKTYSDHIALPVVLAEGEKSETVNTASALWARAKAEITEEQYREFYRHVAHAADEPWLTLHWRAEGKLEYRCLLFVPKAKPFDLFTPERKPRLKLYVKRVFITEDCEELLPPCLRFVKGVVDSEDLPLNISREMLQNNPVLGKIRAGIVKRVMSELAKKAESQPESYLEFWDAFGAVLKEGIYEDAEQRDALLKLARFRSTAGEGWVSLADYVGRMKPGQEAIYTLSGDEADSLRKSPHLEAFRAKGVEVLLLTDPVDEFWVPAIGSHEGKPFRSVTRGAADLSKIEGGAEAKPAADGASDPGIDRLVALLKLALKDAVKDVRRSGRLTDSPVVLVADEHDLDIHLERLLRQHRQLEHAAPRILEINPGHPLIRGMAAAVKANGDSEAVTETAWLLLDQARILDGEVPAWPLAASSRPLPRAGEVR